MSMPRAIHLRKQMARHFRDQLMLGAPSNQDEQALQLLAQQLRQEQVVVKLHARFPLHAKLYLVHRKDLNNPTTGFVGSSNLTLNGLWRQGELNVDVLDHDGTTKLQEWFDARWDDTLSLDISKELLEVLDESWAADKPLSPYLVHLKIAYHLSSEARAGIAQFTVPKVFRDLLLPFQQEAVRIAANHLYKRGGVMLGDVVGLGKTIMASALVKMFDEEFSNDCLIICPKNLQAMWRQYIRTYELRAEVLPLSKAIRQLPERTRKYRLVLIDESHNLRNRETRTYQAVRQYIEGFGAHVILLTATPEVVG